MVDEGLRAGQMTHALDGLAKPPPYFTQREIDAEREHMRRVIEACKRREGEIILAGLISDHHRDPLGVLKAG